MEERKKNTDVGEEEVEIMNRNLPTNRINTCAVDVIVVAWLLSIDRAQFDDPENVIRRQIGTIIDLMRQPFNLSVQKQVNQSVHELTGRVFPAFQSRQTDASEFLASLVAKLGLDMDVNKRSIQVFGTDVPSPQTPTSDQLTKTSEREEETGTIFTIHEWLQASSIAENLCSRLDSGTLDRPYLDRFTRSITLEKFIPLNPFVIHLNRANYDSTVNHAPIAVGAMIAEFDLRSVVFHEGSSIDSGHFTALLKVGVRQWMFYNDTQRHHPITEGEFTDIAQKFKLDTHGVLYFYG